MDREVHVTFRNRDGSPTTEVFPIQDPFGDFMGFQGLELPFPANIAVIGVDGLRVVQVEPGPVTAKLCDLAMCVWPARSLR